MPSTSSTLVYILFRLVLMGIGALLLWAAPISFAGLGLMLLGLVCAVSALTLEKTR